MVMDLAERIRNQEAVVAQATNVLAEAQTQLVANQGALEMLKILLSEEMAAATEEENGEEDGG